MVDTQALATERASSTHGRPKPPRYLSTLLAESACCDAIVTKLPPTQKFSRLGRRPMAARFAHFAPSIGFQVPHANHALGIRACQPLGVFRNHGPAVFRRFDQDVKLPDLLAGGGVPNA